MNTKWTWPSPRTREGGGICDHRVDWKAAMGLLRCFIAIELPAQTHDSIDKATAATRDRVSSELVRWVPIRNVHLTLKFLGDTAASAVPLISAAMDEGLREFRQFQVRIKGFDAFPNRRRPRVLWVGIDAPPVLASLQRELDGSTARLGYASEEREYSPHLTVGRVRENIGPSGMHRIRDALDHATVGELARLTVDAIHLYRSELKPTGSIYSKLHTTPLAIA